MNIKIMLPIFAAALLVTGGGCKEETHSAAAPEAAMVIVAPAEGGRASDKIQVIGQVVADKSVDLIARVDGFLDKRNFSEGDLVKAGDVLYEIEPEQYQADYAAAQAALERAIAASENAEIESERQKTLFSQKAASKRDYDNARTRALESKANVNVCRAALDQAKLNLSYTKIIAPFDGRTGLSMVDVGDMVGSKSAKLTSIISTSPVRVKFKLSELLMLGLTDQRLDNNNNDDDKIIVRLFLDNGTEYKQTGKIAYWDNHISATTGTIEIHALFDNPVNFLVPGMNVRVSLEPEHAPEAVLVPSLSVQEDQLGKFVYVVENNKAERRKVETGSDIAGQAVILSGVKIGEIVVVEGFQKLRNGSPVTSMTIEERKAGQDAVIETIEKRNLVSVTPATPAITAANVE